MKYAKALTQTRLKVSDSYDDEERLVVGECPVNEKELGLFSLGKKRRKLNKEKRDMRRINDPVCADLPRA